MALASSAPISPVPISLNTTATTPSRHSNTIFMHQGAFGGDGSGSGIVNAGKMRVMADFAKAAYNLQSWETASAGGQKINDPSLFADRAYNEIIAQGWIPLDLTPVIDPTSKIAGQSVTNRMAGGYYTNSNAAAFVARSADAIVISFRGTNDMGTNSYDTQGLAPDAIDWFFMSNHYQLLQPLVSAIDKYVSNASNGINTVYVTGHSLGGAMAIRFMSDHSGAKYSATTFAAPGYIPNAGLSLAEATGEIATGRPWQGLATAALTLGTGAASDRDRITHIEINGDGVPDAGPHGGRTIHFEGNETDEVFQFAANHSMDYYRQITDSVDPQSWQRILNESGDPEVFLGGQRVFNDFIVDGRASGMNARMPSSYQNDTLTDPATHDYEIFYGGIGDDTLTGGSDNELMLGGEGNDTIIGGGGIDNLFGGTGNDIFKFSSRKEGRDIIHDFDHGHDKLLFSITAFGKSADFVSGVNPVAPTMKQAFLYNTTTGVLSYARHGKFLFGIDEIATLVGSPTLTESDFQFV